MSIHFKIGAVQHCSVTKIEPKSLLLCVIVWFFVSTQELSGIVSEHSLNKKAKSLQLLLSVNTRLTCPFHFKPQRMRLFFVYFLLWKASGNCGYSFVGSISVWFNIHIRSLFSGKIHLRVIAFPDSCYYTKTWFYSISVHSNTTCIREFHV